MDLRLLAMFLVSGRLSKTEVRRVRRKFREGSGLLVMREACGCWSKSIGLFMLWGVLEGLLSRLGLIVLLEQSFEMARDV